MPPTRPCRPKCILNRAPVKAENRTNPLKLETAPPQTSLTNTGSCFAAFLFSMSCNLLLTEQKPSAMASGTDPDHTVTMVSALRHCTKFLLLQKDCQSISCVTEVSMQVKQALSRLQHDLPHPFFCSTTANNSSCHVRQKGSVKSVSNCKGNKACKTEQADHLPRALLPKVGMQNLA